MRRVLIEGEPGEQLSQRNAVSGLHCGRLKGLFELRTGTR